MKVSGIYFKTCILFFLIYISNLSAQNSWGAYSTKIDIRTYIGKKFRFKAQVRTELLNDSAAARLWVRIDSQDGNTFFDNMGKRPVRNSNWKEFSIEGKFEEKSEYAVFGTLTELNGKFYYDNFVFEIETKPNTWKIFYTANFENTVLDLQAGIFYKDYGVNPHFKAEIVTETSNNNHCLLVEGNGIIPYGQNKETGNYANVNDIKLYYEIYGQGQPLLVLHGNGGSIGNASKFYPELSKHYKVIAIDSRAQGNSTDTDKPLTYDQMTSDINELLNQLHIDSTYIWGQSDGAILGILLAKDYPKKVKKVLAFGSNMQPDSLAIFQWDITATEKHIKETKNPLELKLNRMMLDYPNVAYSELKKIKAAVLIMQGDRDIIRPEHSLKLFQSIPNSQLCILPGTTHGACWEKQALFLMILHNFFDEPFSMPDSRAIFGD